jgi:hypothetical protein
MALTRREQAEYDRLRAKRGGSGSKTPSGRPRSARAAERDEDEGIFVLAGRHAESFLDRMFGSDAKPAPEPEDLDDDDDECDDDEDEEPEPDPTPARGHKYFSGKQPRG